MSTPRNYPLKLNANAMLALMVTRIVMERYSELGREEPLISYKGENVEKARVRSD